MLNEAHLTTLFDSLKELFCWYDTDLTILWANRAAADSLNLQKEDLIGNQCYEFWNQSDTPCPDCPVLEALRTGIPQIIEKETPDGRYWQIQGIPVFDKNGVITNLVEFGLEITERKKAEKSKKENERKFQELFNNALVGIAVHDPNGKMLALNNTAVKIFGMNEKEFFTKDLDFWKGKLLKSNGEPMEMEEFPVNVVIASNSPFEGKIIGLSMSENQHTRWFITSARPIINSNNDIEKIVTTFVEITDQKLAEDALQESEHKFRSLVEQAAEMLFLHETNGRIIDVNKAAEKNTGYTREELLCMNVCDIDPHAQQRNDLERYWKGLSPTDPPITFEVVHKRKDGSVYPAEVTLSKVVISGEYYMLALAKDITGRKNMDEKIKREKKMLSLINNLNQAANRNADLSEIISLYENSIKDLFNVNIATVHLVSEDKKRLVMQNLAIPQNIKQTIEEIIDSNIPQVSINLENSQFYSSLLTKNEPVLSNDSETIVQMIIEHIDDTSQKEFIPIISDLVKDNSVMSVPMVVNKNPLGVLQISSQTEFRQSELRRFKVIAEQFTDLIMRVKTEEALKKSEEQYRLLFNQVPTGVGIGSFSGDILRVNEVFCDMLGFSKKELLEIKIQDLYVQSEQRKQLLHQIKQCGFVRDYEIQLYKKDSSIGDFLVNSEIITYNDEKVLLTSVKEITFLKNTQKQLEQTQKRLIELNKSLEEKVFERTERVQQLLQQKDEFINQLGHDLKNPLGPFIQLLPLLDQHITDPKDKQIIDVLQRNARYMQNLVRKTIELAKLNSSKTHFTFEPIQLSLVIEEVISANHALFTNNDITVKNNVSSELSVYIDHLHIQEVFMNLFNNAVKYTEGSGTILIDAKQVDNKVLVSVEDTGIGLAEDQIPHLFNEYYKADPSRHDFDSSGLGLPICKRIIQRHHGKIWAESKGLGKGSIFHFTIPLHSDT